MSDDINRTRNFVASLYPGPGWRRKVSKMSDSQVLAIYIKEKSKDRKKPEKEKKDDDIPF